MKKYLFLLAFVLPSIVFASIDTNLKYGARGQEVTELQEFLISKGFLSGQATGNFFSLTQKAVVAFQASVGVPSTGFVGLLTRAKVNAELATNIAPSINAEISETGTVSTPVQNSSIELLRKQIALLMQQVSNLQKPASNQVTQIATTTQAISTSTTIATSSQPIINTTLPTTIAQTLEITSVNITANITSAKFEWETNQPTESKIFISGEGYSLRSFASESGLSTHHVVTIFNLPGETSYSYEIEAISGGTVVTKKQGNFATVSPTPLPTATNPTFQEITNNAVINAPSAIIASFKLSETTEAMKLQSIEWNSNLWYEEFYFLKSQNCGISGFGAISGCKVNAGETLSVIFRPSKPIQNYLGSNYFIITKLNLIGYDSNSSRKALGLPVTFNFEVK